MAKLAMPAAVKLLVAQSYARIGADGLAANTASDAITAILTASDWSDAEPTKGFSLFETRALRSWLDRLDGVDQDFDQARQMHGRTNHHLQVSMVQRRRGYPGGRTGRSQWCVRSRQRFHDRHSVPSLLSAAITAVLTTLKPAEREKESKVRADALGQLAAAIDLFDIDRPDDALGLLPAVKEVHERLAIAEGRGKIAPLVAGSKSIAGTAITSKSPAEGPIAGDQNLTITGTGFTGATEVRFGTTPASSYDVVSDGQITATTPAHTAGAVKVRVTGPGGTSPANALSRYTYIAGPQIRKRSGLRGGRRRTSPS